MIISFETAKLAKEKRFDEIIHSLYDCNGMIESPLGYLKGITKNSYLSKYKGNVCSAPTQSLLQKWLREEHHIDVIVNRAGPENDIPKGYVVDIYTEELHIPSWELKYRHDSYEEALEIGLFEALKLIK